MHIFFFSIFLPIPIFPISILIVLDLLEVPKTFTVLSEVLFPIKSAVASAVF